MGRRKPQSQQEWAAEAAYCKRTSTFRSFGNFNNDPACFARYCDMQARFAREDGATAEAGVIAAAGKGN